MALKTQGVFLTRNGVEVAEITGFDGPDGEAGKIDVTHLRATRKLYLQGLADEGNISFQGLLNPDDAAQMSMKADRDAQSSSTYALNLTDEPPTVLTFEAFCSAFKISGAPDGAIALAATLQITGEVVWS